MVSWEYTNVEEVHIGGADRRVFRLGRKRVPELFFGDQPIPILVRTSKQLFDLLQRGVFRSIRMVDRHDRRLDRVLLAFVCEPKFRSGIAISIAESSAVVRA